MQAESSVHITQITPREDARRIWEQIEHNLGYRLKATEYTITEKCPCDLFLNGPDGVCECGLYVKKSS